ncbi:MAG: alpha/beta hydrolase [Propionibacteriaceae bacterium]|jgi:3-oxoadipate enol-lactonase|nr:alpha/beta hydrolase [Propionibacteriaceae bacterium]
MPELTVGGVRLFYEERGDPEASQTIAFLNGVMASTTSWDLLSPVFVQMGFRVVLHDFKGQMKSDKPAGPYSFLQHADETRQLLAALGVDRPHLVGTSYGGEVAMKYASAFPDQVRSLTVIDSVSELDEVVRGFVVGWKVLCDQGDGEVFFQGMAPSIYGPDFMAQNKAMLDQRAAAFKSAPPDYFTGQKTLYDTFVNDVEMTEELARITCPTLVLCGEDDILKPPRFSRLIAQRIPGAEFLLVPRCGHVAIFERPAELSSAILGFILKQSVVE